ncbi:hypothetical protein BDV3_007190 [Batrachochytrium dendrobatidis]
MYSPNALVHNVVEVDKLYVQKLRESIDEMFSIKQNAIANEDYTTADQMRLKITALQFQLIKMEDQFNADVLTNIITHWQTDLATSIQTALSNPLTFSKFIGVGMLQAQFQVDLINIIKTIPVNYCDAIIRSVLVINPQELPDSPKSPYGWDFLSKKIPTLISKSNDVIDAVRATVTLVITDIVSTVLGLTTSMDIRRETYDLVLRHAFNYFHYMSLRRMSQDIEGRIFEKIFIRFSIIIGDISDTANSRRDIYKFTLGYMDPQKKITSEEIIMVLSSIRYIGAKTKTEDEAVALITLMRELISFHDKSRKTSLKIAAIQALERLIQPLEFGSQCLVGEPAIWNEVADIYKKARKWSSNEDEKSSALHLLVIILVNARFEFFAQNMDSFLNSDLCPKGKVKSYSYECILQLLRGRYYNDTREHWRERANGTFHFGHAYGSLTRSPEDQSSGGVANRLNVICELLFFRRKGPILDEHLDTCVDIVVQISAHNLQIGLKLISELMNTNSVDSGPDVFYIGVRALRTIVNPESGFSSFAYCRSMDNFQTIIKEFPFDLEINFTHILNYIDVQVGVGVVGTSGQVLDPSTNSTGIKQIIPLSRNFSSEQGSRDNILAMLHNIEVTSSQTSSSTDDLVSTSPTLSMSNLNLRGSVVSPLARSATARLMREAGHGSNPGSLSPLGMAQPLTSERRNSSMSLLDTYRNSYRRDSQLGMGPLVSPTFSQDVSSKELNDKVHATMKEWFEVCHADSKLPSKYHVAASMIDLARVRKRANIKLKPEQKLSIRVLKEVIRTIPFVPAPEFIGGNLFIGVYLNHIFDEIGAEVAVSLRTIFELYPPLRIGILNGFMNYIKNSLYQDDISICTIINFVAQLTRIWVADFEQSGPVDQRSFLRVSCKVDAAIIIGLCRATSLIRKPCLQIMLDMYTIQQTFETHQNTIHEMPLAAILVQMETTICKQGMYAFLEKCLVGHLISPRVATSLRTLTFLDVASSDYTVLFRYYLGELAQRFATYGRSKATRHCAKFLRLLAIPMIKSPPGANNAPAEDIARFSALMVVSMALSGVPLVSEVDYISLKPQSVSDETLFHLIKPMLSQIIASETFVEVKPVLDSVYFLHRGMMQLFVFSELLLLQNYSEVRHNSAKVINKRYIDNIMYALRRLSQSPGLDAAIEDESVLSLSLSDMFAEFITLACVPLSDMSFLNTGPVWRLKTALNVCVAVQRFAESLSAVKRSLQRRVIITQDLTELERFEKSTWSTQQRRLVISGMREWYEIVLEISPSIPITNDTRRSVNLRRKLLRKVGLATERVLNLGNVFIDEAIPSGILTWLTTLETNGYRVFTPDFLYGSEEALGTVLANSYSSVGVHSQVFFEAIFEQILPQLDENPRLHIFGDNRRMSYAEDYFAGMHSLPLKTQEGDSPALIYPDISRINAIRLRQHFGSLLFFGLFNLMNVSKVVRSRSLVFVRELLIMFCADDSFDAHSYFSDITGAFYSGSGSILRPKILDISITMSTLFEADSGSFLWEAVRCFRSAQNQTTVSTLVPTQRWVMELIIPWCRFADFTSLSDDVVNAEFFRFMMDVAFTAGSEHHDYMHTCWSEISKSPQNGSINTDIMIDFVIQVSARFDQFRNESLALISTLFSAHPENVAAALAYHLKSSAFPWRADGGSSRKALAPHLRDYIALLETSLQSESPRNLSTNDYTLLCRCAVILAADLLRQGFGFFIPHISVLVNFLLVHLSVRLQDLSPATILIVGLVEGFVAWSHETGNRKNPDFVPALVNIRKLMGLFEARDCEVTWEFMPPNDSILSDLPSIWSKDFVDLILGIFSLVRPSIRQEMAEEVLFWINEGFLSSSVTSRALEVYYMLVADTPLPEDLLDPFTGRILDHLTILMQLEGDVMSQTLKAGSEDKLSATGWSALSKGKVDIKIGTAKVIFGIMQVHGILMRKYQEQGCLIENGELFWPTLGLLYLPADEFSDVYINAIDNLIYFIANAGPGLKSPEFLDPFTSHLAERFPGLQQILIPAMFCKHGLAQAKSFELLLLAWLRLSDQIVDSNETGTLFIILYTSLWIFSNLCNLGTDPNHIATNVQLFKEALALKNTNAFAEVHLCFQTILDAINADQHITETMCDELFERTMTSFMSAFIPEYINNISEFLVQAIMLEGTYGRLALRMAGVLWCMTAPQGFQNIGSLRNLVRRLPFHGNVKPETMMLYRSVLQDKFEGMPVKDLDLVSQGRIESFPDKEPIVGSVKTASMWFSVELGIKPSNTIYTALLN